MKKINIAIDGTSGSGKGITTKLLAKKLNYNYLDTGAMYRAIGYFLDSKNIEKYKLIPQDLDDLKLNFDKNNEILLNGQNIENKVRTPRCGMLASKYASIGIVRDFLGKIQRQIVAQKGYIAEGRDIGSVIMPEAELKIYLTATVKVRAERRLLDFKKKGIKITLDELEKQIEQRDFQDINREIAPLTKVDDAIEIDTSEITIEEQVNKIFNLAQNKMNI